MQEKDVPGIMEIESVSFGKHHWSDSSFVLEMNNNLGNYYVAIDNDTGKVLGYSGFWLIENECHVTTIASKPELRGFSIGELLLQNMIDEAYKKGGKWLTLEVRATNVPAQGLYFKYGFKSLGLRRKYYQDNNEDALIMWTENIWDESYKVKFNDLKQKLNEKNKFNVIFS